MPLQDKRMTSTEGLKSLVLGLEYDMHVLSNRTLS